MHRSAAAEDGYEDGYLRGQSGLGPQLSSPDDPPGYSSAYMHGYSVGRQAWQRTLLGSKHASADGDFVRFLERVAPEAAIVYEATNGGEEFWDFVNGLGDPELAEQISQADLEATNWVYGRPTQASHQAAVDHSPGWYVCDIDREPELGPYPSQQQALNAAKLMWPHGGSGEYSHIRYMSQEDLWPLKDNVIPIGQGRSQPKAVPHAFPPGYDYDAWERAAHLHQVKVAQIARSITVTNPTLDWPEAIALANDTLRQYPKVSHVL